MGVLPSPLRSARALRLPDALGRKAADAAVVTVLLFGAAFAGLLCVFLPWTVVIAMTMMVVLPLLIWHWPWVGIGLYIVVVIISPDQKISDVLTGAAQIILGLKMLADKQRTWPVRSVFLPYAIFIACVVLSLALALVFFRNQISYIYGDGRVFIYWLWLPLLYWLTNREDQGFKKLANLLAFVASMIALIAILQWGTGLQIVAAGRVGALETAGAAQGNVTRVQMPGFVFVMFAFIWAVVSLAHKRRLLLLIPASVLLLVALYVNFGRALWIWTAAGVLLSLFMVGPRRAVPMIAVLVTAAVFIGGSLALFKPTVIDNVVTRLSSVRDEGGSRTSLGWRKLENEDAMARIARSPLVGVGLGGEYRRWISEIRTFAEHTRYVHNSYFFVALKLGIPALLALSSMLLVCWLRGRAAINKVAVDRRAMQIAAVAMLPAALGLSVTQPELVNAYGPIFFSCLLVVLISDRQLQARPSEHGEKELGVVKLRGRRSFV